MVSSGTVTADASELTSKLSMYSSSVGELASSWKGSSYDSISAQANNFVSEYQATITSQMSSFAEAINLYEQYQRAKRNAEISRNNYNQAIANKDSSSVSRFSSDVSRYTEEYTRLKGQIESALQAASSTSLEATPLSGAKGDFVNYYQYNYSQPYSQGTIATSGCGPTSLAMVLTYLLGEEVSPVETAAKGNGRYTCSKGTTWNYFGDMASQYGVECTQMSMTANNLVSSLKNGKTVILSMGPGHFTKAGHFIVARGLDENGRVIVADPNSESRSNQTWDVGTLVSEGKQLWAMDA